jgi:hypothetical protein
MRSFSKVAAVTAILTCLVGAAASGALAQNRIARKLVSELQAEKTTNEARKQLLRFGKSDPAIRSYLGLQLPPMIEPGPSSCPHSDIRDIDARWHTCPWYNAVELAGKLNISGAASALGRWIAVRSSPIISGLGPEMRLEPYPAATALWEIGDPAVPTLKRAFYSDSRKHFLAERALCIIDTPESKLALGELLPRESDPSLQAAMGACLTHTTIR